MTQELLQKPLVTIPSRGHKRHTSISALHDAASASEDRNIDGIALWYDTDALTALSNEQREAIIGKIIESGFNGVVLYPQNWNALVDRFPSRMTRIVHLVDLSAWEQADAAGVFADAPAAGSMSIVSSDDAQVLSRAVESGWTTCFRTHVDDAASLHDSFHHGMHHECVMVSFKDPTNIPLELVIAELHTSPARLLKEVGTDVDDAVIALGVLELGSDGVVASFVDPAQFDTFIAKLDAVRNPTMKVQAGTVVSTRHLGLGYRACIDTTHMFEPDEGLLVGSTSAGGILCCPEVFFLPYMELRPFRINAASIHSYVFHANDRTNYISELKAGSQITAVNSAGRTRQIYVGRVKTEIRPLILIEVEFDGGETVNIVMQDDWHVRVFSDQSLPRHVTELRSGDRVLGYTTQPGRHVGVKVNEHIIEV